MGRFFPLYIRRSDGVLEVTARNGKREKNEPTPAQLDPAADAKGVSDYYRLMSINDAKYTDWRKKLGGMLIRELGGKEHLGPDKAYLLYQLPENYRLYEHIKTKAQPKGSSAEEASKSAKNHAGGNNERQDAYLYGHPLGRKKRYRSPADFFPHLLWLATDPQGDPDNCTCKICAPDELQPEDDRVKSELVKREDDAKPTYQSQAQVIVEVPKRPTSASSQNTQTRVQGSTSQLPSRGLTPQAPPLQQSRSVDQQVDSQYNRFVYRPGELVWLNKGLAWGLAIVARRFNLRSSPNTPPQRGYLVQPLSIPGMPDPQMPIFQEDRMRPWLAWSPPGFTMEGLLTIPNVSLDNVDWQGAVMGRYGHGDARVDASILAARAIDGSYTLFGQVRAAGTDQNTQERRWNGIFIGAEKFWVGEPSRLRPGSGNDVFVITDIVEKQQSSAAMQMQYGPLVQLVGDIYQYTELPAGTTTPVEPNLPSRMREDMARRNVLMSNTKRTQFHWKLMHRQARLGLDAIRGRWYEPTVATQILFDEGEFEVRQKTGSLDELGGNMNARGDANPQSGANRHLMPLRKQNRHEALGAAVPKDMAIMDGVDPPPDEELVKLVKQHQAASQQGQGSEMQLEDIVDLSETR